MRGVKRFVYRELGGEGEDGSEKRNGLHCFTWALHVDGADGVF